MDESIRHPEATYFVALTGDDANPGTFEAPFATLNRARDAVRKLKASGTASLNGATVLIRGGSYPVAETFELTAEDSGTGKAPVIWSSYPGERAHFIGGKVIDGFGPVTEPSVLSRLDPEARKHVVQADLGAQGVTDYGDISKGHGMELFFNGEPMTVARYPNDDWVKIASVPQHGELKFRGLYRGPNPLKGEDGIIQGRHYGRFMYEGDRPDRWQDTDNVGMFGYWGLDWSDSFHRIARLDTVEKEIWPDEPYHGYGYRKEQRFFYFNILEELDEPGEWFVDQDCGILYFWPPEPLEDGEACVSVLEDPMLCLKETSHLVIRDLVFECSRGQVVQVEGGTHNVIAGCTIRNVWGKGVVIQDGTANGIVSCDIYNIGHDGVKIFGGNRKTLTPAGNYGVNNHVHHFSRIKRTYCSALSLDGVGNRLAHNLIHDGPHEGIRFHGNDHMMEYNEIHDVALQTGDVPAIGTSHDWTYRDNTIRYNYFHHIHGPGKLGCMILYFDLPTGGSHVFGNIFYDIDMGFFTNSGRDMIIENNIFVKCDPSIGWNVWRDPQYFEAGGPWRMVELLHEVRYDHPPYITRYPRLMRLFRDGDPALPTGNIITRNISTGGRFLQFWDRELDFDMFLVVDNLITDPEILKWAKEKRGEGYDVYGHTDTRMVEELEGYGNKVVEDDAGLVDPDNGDFRLRDDSPAWKLGFQPIPYDRIGLHTDEYRTSLPERNLVAQE